MKTAMDWVNSAGGPLIVAPAEIAPHWQGVRRWRDEPGATAGPVGDYARACNVSDYLGVLEVGPGRCLILGDEPMQTTFIPKPGGGVLVRWMYAENEASVRRAVETIPEAAWEATAHRIEVGQEGILVFDSAFPGDALPPPEDDPADVPWIRIGLPPGSYLVDTSDYEPDASTRLILHRLRRRGG